jgi:hypothetical protein
MNALVQIKGNPNDNIIFSFNEIKEKDGVYQQINDDNLILDNFIVVLSFFSYPKNNNNRCYVYVGKDNIKPADPDIWSDKFFVRSNKEINITLSNNNN